ncbi:MAG: hypothetical protein GX589_07595 [Deltaproteobacteria bacterium]|nr:hypothetical protein [Deltaproteobacteria bacterium]
MSSQPEAPQDIEPPFEATELDEVREEVPFTVEVVDEVNDGKKIHLRLRLQTKGVWDPSLMALKLSGLNSGRVVRAETHVLADLLEKEETKGAHQPLPEELFLTVSISALDLTDYQVELLWGEEAAAVGAVEAETAVPAGTTVPAGTKAAAGEPTVSAKHRGGLLIRNLTWQERRDCNQSPCQLSYQLQGEFYNSGSALVSGAILGVQLRAPGDASTLKEEQVRIDGLELAPGEGRQLQIEIDQGQADMAQQGLQPALRLIDEW